MTRIVDTSVAVKWAVAEEGSDRALLLYGGDVVAPDLLRPELANALVKKVRRGEIGALQAEAAYAEIEATLTFIPTPGLWRRALAVALALDHPAYDCGYLALAEATGMKVVTADRRFVMRCSGTEFDGFIELL